MSVVATPAFVPFTNSPREEILRVPFVLKTTNTRYERGTKVRVQFGSFGPKLDANTWAMRLTLPDGQTCDTRRCTLVYVAPEIDELAGDDSQSILGETVEPDGFDPDGSPSWLVAMGLI